MKTCRTNFPAPLGLFLVVLTLGGAARAADLVDNWSFLEPGVVPKNGNFASAGIPIFIRGLEAGGVVDATSTPANPFPGASRALYVEPSPDNGSLRIFTRPFLDKTPSQGSYEFTFRLVEGGFGFNMQAFPGPWDPKGNWFYSDAEHIYSVSFIPGKPLFSGPPKQFLVTGGVKAIATEENYTFRIEWQTSGDQLEFHFLLNGEPLTAANGAPVSIPVPVSKFADNALGFRLTSGSADNACFTGFIGSIRAEALSP